jgi:hypothetical protein
MSRHFTKELGRTPKNEDIFALTVGDQSSINVALTHYIDVLQKQKPESWKEEISSIKKLQKVLEDAANIY